jgi:hypothetical protein
VLASPNLSSIGLFDFHRGMEAINAGREAVARVLPQLQEVLELAQQSFLARQRSV